MYRILIVDDEPMIRKGISKLIEKSGYPISSIRTAENGTEALSMIEEERPDFLFTDIRMPRMDGIELCQYISTNRIPMQIVVVSGYSDFEYARRCMAFGVKEYLLKPINQKQLHELLGKLIDLAEQPAPIIPISKFEPWVAEAELAIWELKEDAIIRLSARLFDQLVSLKLPDSQLGELLNEIYEMVIRKLNHRSVYHFESQEGASERLRQDRFELLLKKLLQEIRVKRKGRVKDPVEEAKHYIDKHLAKEVSLEEVADFIGLNASYFSQLFKQGTNETFVQYRIRRRMEKAKQLLTLPHYKITDISYEVGYADHPHFTKTFKKYTGYTPSDYRESMGIE